MAPGYSMANTIGISTKARGRCSTGSERQRMCGAGTPVPPIKQRLDLRILPATAASLASAAQ
jgi:hypothetical protein